MQKKRTFFGICVWEFGVPPKNKKKIIFYLYLKFTCTLWIISKVWHWGRSMIQSIRNNNLSVSTTTCIICHKLKYMLDETQAGIKISRRNINNLRYTDDTTLMAESEEEIKSLLMKVKDESERVGLKLNI